MSPISTVKRWWESGTLLIVCIPIIFGVGAGITAAQTQTAIVIRDLADAKSSADHVHVDHETRIRALESATSQNSADHAKILVYMKLLLSKQGIQP